MASNGKARCLTVHSSRTRIGAPFKYIGGAASFHPDWHVAGRLNSGVRPWEIIVVNEAKKARVVQAAHEASERMQKHLHSLHHCLLRSDVMRYHHNGLVQEMLDDDRPEAFSDVKKVRFLAYIAFWYTALAGVIERYEELRDKSTIPADAKIDFLLTEHFKNIVKPFRNSVAHCSDFDDRRTLEIFDHESTVPDQAAAISDAFHAYFKARKRAKS